MFKKLAKIKYLPNNFQVIQDGDHVLCAISGKIPIDKLTYWNVELQEAYFSYGKPQLKEKKKYKLFPSIMSPNPLVRIFENHFF